MRTAERPSKNTPPTCQRTSHVAGGGTPADENSIHSPAGALCCLLTLLLPLLVTHARRSFRRLTADDVRMSTQQREWGSRCSLPVSRQTAAWLAPAYTPSRSRVPCRSSLLHLPGG